MNNFLIFYLSCLSFLDYSSSGCPLCNIGRIGACFSLLASVILLSFRCLATCSYCLLSYINNLSTANIDYMYD